MTLMVAAVAAAMLAGLPEAWANVSPSVHVDESKASLSADRQAPTPTAWLDFCRRNPAACRPSEWPGASLALSGAVLAAIRTVNAEVNATITPATDRELYGEAEHWTLPSAGRGDCEDVALLKRERLMALGIPSSVLLMTIVRDRQGAGHAVLTVVTDRGDFILDNQTDAVTPWYETGHRFLMRQSRTDPHRWQALGNARSVAAGRHVVRLTDDVLARTAAAMPVEDTILVPVDGRAS
jgi:predicted transglutaminase-like cysteine proteinase